MIKPSDLDVIFAGIRHSFIPKKKKQVPRQYDWDLIKQIFNEYSDKYINNSNDFKQGYQEDTDCILGRIDDLLYYDLIDEFEFIDMAKKDKGYPEKDSFAYSKDYWAGFNQAHRDFVNAIYHSTKKGENNR